MYPGKQLAPRDMPDFRGSVRIDGDRIIEEMPSGRLRFVRRSTGERPLNLSEHLKNMRDLIFRDFVPISRVPGRSAGRPPALL